MTNWAVVTDWADEIAFEFLSGSDISSEDWHFVLLAIRKAKADGMREAADMIEGQGVHLSYASGLRIQANKIEKGRA